MATLTNKTPGPQGKSAFERHPKREPGLRPGGLDLDRAAVSLCDLGGDVEAKAEPLRVAGYDVRIGQLGENVTTVGLELELAVGDVVEVERERVCVWWN